MLTRENVIQHEQHEQTAARNTPGSRFFMKHEGERLEIQGTEKLAEYIKANTELEVSYDHTRRTITIPLKKRIDALAALAAAEQSGMEWGEIQTREDSLDDVFIKLVSEPLGEQGETAIDSGKKRRR